MRRRLEDSFILLASAALLSSVTTKRGFGKTRKRRKETICKLQSILTLGRIDQLGLNQIVGEEELRIHPLLGRNFSPHSLHLLDLGLRCDRLLQLTYKKNMQERSPTVNEEPKEGTERHVVLPAIWKVVGMRNRTGCPEGDSQSLERSTRRFLHDFCEVGTQLTKWPRSAALRQFACTHPP
ncbi:unnamed protein product [Prunus armeniaca]